MQLQNGEIVFIHIYLKKLQLRLKKKNYVKGLNFWTYSGEGRPIRPGKFWKKGDEILGDPPHELQGWYGVYNSDVSTLKIIKEYASQINN